MKYELKKIANPLLVISVIAAVFLRVFLVYSYDRAKDEIDTEIYREYVDHLAAMDELEQTPYLEGELARIDECLERAKKAQQDFDRKKITLDELHDINVAGKRAEAEKPVAQRLLEKSMYYTEIRAEGKKPEFFYDLDSEKYLKKLIGPNVVLLLVVAFAGVYLGVLDAESGSRELVAVTGNAKAAIYIKRPALLAVTVLMCALVSSCGEGLIYYIKGLDWTGGYEICSIMSLLGTPSGTGILRFIIILLVLRVLVCVLYSLVSYFVGVISGNTMTAGFICALLVLVPVVSIGAFETILAELILR